MYHLYRKSKNRYEKGKIAEQMARNYLVHKKYNILHQNYSNAFGEIDIIATKKNNLSFIEVKSSSKDFISDENVTQKKCKKILLIAELFLYQKKIKHQKISFEIICVNIKKTTIHHFAKEFFDF